MDLDAFYADIYEMADHIPTSSQPSALSIETALEAAAAAGDEVLGIFISGRMSGTFEGVARAARETAKRHPDFKNGAYRQHDQLYGARLGGCRSVRGA